MKTFTSRCCQALSRWRTRVAGGLTMAVLLVLLSLFSNNVAAQCTPCGTPTGTITIDGNPCDWRNANLSMIPGAIVSYRSDPFGNGVVDDQFTQGSKDFFRAEDLRWTIGQTKQKNDIANAAVAIANGNLYFAGDRTSNEGASQIGFWFYLGGTAPVTQSDGTKNFAPEHQVGDILVLADFSSGGRLATVSVYRWVGSGGNVPNTNGTLSSVSTCGSVIVAQNNDVDHAVPGEWSFEQPCYERNMFYEGEIPLSCLIAAGTEPCFGSFLLETRSSPSITASLDDFVAGGFDARPNPTVQLQASNPSCAGGSNGSINLTRGGTGNNPTYVWTKNGGAMVPANQANVEDPTGLSAGTYNVTVTVTGATNCTSTATAQIVISDPAAVSASASAVGTNPSCNGGSNGSINLTASGSGGTGAVTVISYAWTKNGGAMAPANQANVEDPAGLTAGTYNVVVTVRDANSCTATASTQVVLTNPAAVTASASAVGSNPTCNAGTNGSINLSVDHGGGTGARTVSYAWTKNGGAMAPANQAAVEDPAGLTAGTYNVTVTVTDANSCTATASTQVVLTDPAAVTASASAVGTNPSCNAGSNGSINLTVSHGGGTGARTVAYAWTKNGGAMAPANQAAVEDPAGLTAGTYNVTVTVTDANSCTATASTQVVLNNPPAVSATASAVGTNPACFGGSDGSINLTASGSGGTGAVTVISYAWTKNGGAMAPANQANVEDPAGLTAGTYNVTVTVRDANSCTATASTQVVLTNPTQITASASAVPTNPSCNGGSNGSINLTVSTNGGAASYVWTKNGGAMAPANQANVEDPAGLSAGTYNVTVTVGTGSCTATATAQAIVTNPPAVTASASAVGTNPSCNAGSNGSINLTVTHGGGTGARSVAYAWTKNGGAMAPANQAAVEDPAGLTAGTYNVTVTVTDANSCTATASTQVVLNNPPAVSATASAVGTNPACNGGSNGSINLTASGSGGSGAVTVISYAWTKNGGAMAPANQAAVEDPSGLTAGTYNVTVTVRDANSCTATASTQVVLTDPAAVTASATAVGTNSTCGGADGSINLTVTHGGGTGARTVSYLWTRNGGAMVPANQANVEDPAGLSAGTYNVMVTVTDANSCSATATAQVVITTTQCDVLCTYTQGAYGNDGGMHCDGTPAPNMFSTFETIQTSITNQGNSIVIGGATRSVIVTNSATDVNKVIALLPGGGSARAFDHNPAGQIAITDLPASYLSRQGRINNNLFSQTLTLSINMGVKPGLGSFALQANQWLVTAAVTDCGSTTIRPCEFSCMADPVNAGQYIWTVSYTPYKVFNRIPTALYNALPTKNVAGLLLLANNTLNGDALPTGVTATDVMNAVDMINNAFDECRSFVGWYSGATPPSVNSFCTLPSNTTPCPAAVTSTSRGSNEGAGSDVTTTSRSTQPGVEGDAVKGLKVTAYPNPYNDVVRFTIQSEVSGQAQLVLYNALGQQVQTIYDGHIQANRNQVVEYRAATRNQGSMFYILTIGGKRVTGKLVKLGE